MNPAFRIVRVARKTQEAEGICSFELVAEDGAGLPPFSAGSHIDVRAGSLIRQYSLCNDPAETHRYQIAVLREPASRGGSLAMHALEVGARIAISAPRNHFALAREAPHSLLLAGGIGITPILCMAERLASTGARFELHYCTRSAARTAFSQRIAASAFAAHVQFHYDEGAPAQRFAAREVIASQPSGTHLYVCGPSGFMDAILALAREAGWPEERLHREYFNAAPVDTSHDGAFDVQVASTGAMVRVENDCSVVAALARAGITITTSCEQGVCGTCLTRVIGGTPDHRDMYLTPEEHARGDQFLPCCSRSLTPILVLDI